MKAAIKLAIAVGAISISTSASAMPPAVPGSWYTMMWAHWLDVAQHRTCKNKIVVVCDGVLGI